MADGLDIVAVEIDHVRAVVVQVVARPRPWRAVVGPARGERRRVEGVHRRPVRCCKGEVERCAWAAGLDEEIDAARRSPTDCALDLDFLDPEGRERLPVKMLARLEVADRKREVVDEDLSGHGRSLLCPQGLPLYY